MLIGFLVRSLVEPQYARKIEMKKKAFVTINDEKLPLLVPFVVQTSDTPTVITNGSL